MPNVLEMWLEIWNIVIVGRENIVHFSNGMTNLVGDEELIKHEIFYKFSSNIGPIPPHCSKWENMSKREVLPTNHLCQTSTSFQFGVDLILHVTY